MGWKGWTGRWIPKRSKIDQVGDWIAGIIIGTVILGLIIMVINLVVK